MRVFFLCCAIFCAAHVQAEGIEKKTWESTQFLWNFGIISQCDFGLDNDPQRYFEQDCFDASVYQGLQSQQILWVTPKHVGEFCTSVLPKVEHPFLLIVSDGDESFPSECPNLNVETLISHDKVVHIFAQNCDYKGDSKKISHLPIGVDFHTMAYKKSCTSWGDKASPLEQEQQLVHLLRKLKPTSMRKKKAYVDFQLQDTMHGNCNRAAKCGEDRTSIFNRLLPTGLIDHAKKKMKRIDLWKKKGNYAFSISPHGNGLDCHRTWEDLILGCIVIVKTSSLDPLYEGLPVVIIQDWSEITEENMDKWLTLYGDAFTNPLYRQKLTTAYWFDKIQAYVR